MSAVNVFIGRPDAPACGAWVPVQAGDEPAEVLGRARAASPSLGEEYIISDHEGLTSCAGEPGLRSVCFYAAALELETAVGPYLQAQGWWALDDHEDAESLAEAARDALVLVLDGTYSGDGIDEAVGEAMIEQGLLGDIPGHLAPYIDAEAYGRDMMMDLQAVEWEEMTYVFCR